MASWFLCFMISYKAAIQVSARSWVSSEGLTEDSSVSKLQGQGLRMTQGYGGPSVFSASLHLWHLGLLLCPCSFLSLMQDFF